MTKRLALTLNCHLSCHLLCACRADASTLRGWKTKQSGLHRAILLHPHHPQQSTGPWYAPPPHHLPTDQPTYHQDPHQCNHPTDPHHHESHQDPLHLFPHPALGTSTENNAESYAPWNKNCCWTAKKKSTTDSPLWWMQSWSNILNWALGLL